MLSNQRPMWRSRTIALLMLLTAVINLGDIWRFPVKIAEYGGLAFIVLYLICGVMLSIPLLIAQMVIGRRGKDSPSHSFARLAVESGESRAWSMVGGLSIILSVVVVAIFCIFSARSMAFLLASLSDLTGHMNSSESQVMRLGPNLAKSGTAQLIWFAVFLIPVALISAGGLRVMENAARLITPLLILAAIVMISITLPLEGSSKAVDALLTFDVTKLSRQAFLDALEFSFFSLSLGTGVAIAYSVYLPKDFPIPGAAVAVVVTDVFVAFTAAFILLPLFEFYGNTGSAGPTLAFFELPAYFHQTDGGALLSMMFYFALLMTGVTSTLALFEPAVMWFQKAISVSRAKAVLITSVIVWLSGSAMILSLTDWQDVSLCQDVAWLAGSTPCNGQNDLFDIVNGITTRLLLPAVGFLILWFVCRELSHDLSAKELKMSPGFTFKVWQFMMRYVARLALLIVLLNGLKLITFTLDLFEI